MTIEEGPAPIVASGSALDLPGAPDRPGLSFRRWRDEGDLDGFVAVVNDSWAADGLVMRTGPEQESTWLRHTAGSDLERDLVLAELDGHLVGFARTNTEVEETGRRHWISLMLAPAGRLPGIRETLQGWAETHVRERAAADTASSHVLSVWVNDAEVDWRAFLETQGYRPVRVFTEMVRESLEDLPDRPLPAGLEVRPVRWEDVPTILAAKKEAFRDAWGHTPLTEADVRAVLEHPHTDLPLWVVAWDGDEVAGMVIVHELRDDNAAFGWRRGWLASVGTRRPWRNRGLASALCVRAMEGLRARGMTSAGLGVDTENADGALSIYERLGFRVDVRSTVLERPLEG